MRCCIQGLLVAAVLLAGAVAAPAQQKGNKKSAQAPKAAGKKQEAAEETAAVYPYNRQWHAGYADVLWGRPVPVVVPPVATWQTVWGQGIGATQIVPVYAQFQGPSGGEPNEQFRRFRPVPYWPHDTRQLGAYAIRGPWQPVPGVPGIPPNMQGEYLSPPPVGEVGIPRSFGPLGKLWRRLWHIDY